MFLSVVIPVFNEEGTIVPLLDEHIARLGGIERWEIVCVDDASTDQSLSLLKAYAAREPRLRILRHESNQGISASFQHLFREAKGDFVYLTAADNQWPAVNLTRLLEKQGQSHADLVIGVRQDRQKVYSLGRQLLSFGFNFLAKVFLKINVQDANGIKLGRRDIFSIPLESKSFFAEIERLAMAYRKGYRIVYEPVVFGPRQFGQSQGGKIKNIVATLKDFLRFIIR